MVGVQAGMGLSARLRGAIISATPMLVLGLTMFVVALNMRWETLVIGSCCLCSTPKSAT